MALMVANGSAGCAPPGSWTGKVEGHVLSVKSAIFGMGTPPGTLAPLNPNVAGAVVLSDAPDPCADVTNNALSSRKSYLVMGLVKPTASDVPLSTYLAINDLQQFTNALHTTSILDIMVNGANVTQLYVTNPTCGQVLDPNQSMAVDGTVTVGSWDPKNTASGIYDLTMGSQDDPIRGSFNAAWCPGLMPFLAANPNFLAAASDPNTPPPGCH